MTTNEKIDFVALIIDEDISSDKFTFINTLLGSIDTDELIQIYWDSIEKHIKPIVDVIQHQLVGRLCYDKGKSLHFLIDRTIEEIKSNKHLQLRKIRSLLTKSVEYLTDQYRLKIFDVFVFDEIKGNRKLAFKAISGLINKDVESKLLESWDENFDEECLTLLINETEFIKNISTKHLLELANLGYMKDWLRRKAVIELGLRNISNVENLKDEDPTTYLYIASESKIDVSDKWILKKINNLSSPAQLSVFIYSIGNLGKYNLLKKVYNEYDEIKERMHEKYFNI